LIFEENYESATWYRKRNIKRYYSEPGERREA